MHNFKEYNNIVSTFKNQNFRIMLNTLYTFKTEYTMFDVYGY